MNNCFINESNKTNKIFVYNNTDNEQFNIRVLNQENEMINKNYKIKGEKNSSENESEKNYENNQKNESEKNTEYNQINESEKNSENNQINKSEKNNENIQINKSEKNTENNQINEINEINEDNENEKLIKTLNAINKKLNDKNNKNLTLEKIYLKYNKKDEDKAIINEKNSKCKNYIFFFIFAILFVIINLIGIFTIRGILNSLYEIFIISIKYFLYKKSDLEKNELTDFVSLYKSKYNFYKQYFNDISKNEIDFDLMMFWNFLGSLLYKYCNFTFTSILLFLLNIILFVFIGGFDYLDIDEKTHKYSFFQILYISLVYFFLWITVGASALLSQQIYIDYYQIFKKSENKKQKKVDNEKKLKEEEKKNLERIMKI